MTRAIAVLAMVAALGLAGGQSGATALGSGGAMNGNKGVKTMSSTDRTAESRAVSADNGMLTLDVQNTSDQDFVNAAAAGGMYEIKEGKLAEKKGATKHLRAIGARLAADHARLGDELQGIAKQQGFTLPSAVTGVQEQMIEALEGKSGTAFDKEYLKQQTEAHRATIAKFEAEAKGGESKALREFAAKALPILKEHLKLVTEKDEG